MMDLLAWMPVVGIGALFVALVGGALWYQRTKRIALLHRIEAERHRLEAAEAAGEYRRALRDYTQLTRHRLANPLTAITVGIQTLRDLDLDEATRLEVLDAMHETAARLERAVLHPELLSPEEAGLVPVPTLSDSELAQQLQADAVHAEIRAREVNRSLLEHVAAGPDRDQEVGFLCECWATECVETISLPLDRYFAVHQRPDQFVICPGHDLPTVEYDFDRDDDHWIVRKTERALDTAGVGDGSGS